MLREKPLAMVGKFSAGRSIPDEERLTFENEKRAQARLPLRISFERKTDQGVSQDSESGLCCGGIRSVGEAIRQQEEENTLAPLFTTCDGVRAQSPRAGVSEAVAMEITGHKTLSMYRGYRIVDKRDLREATARLQAHPERQPKTARWKQFRANG